MNKILVTLSAVGFVLAYIFYALFDKERCEKLVQEHAYKVTVAKAEAKKQAEEQHNAIKNDNVGMANDIYDMLDK